MLVDQSSGQIVDILDQTDSDPFALIAPDPTSLAPHERPGNRIRTHSAATSDITLHTLRLPRNSILPDSNLGNSSFRNSLANKQDVNGQDDQTGTTISFRRSRFATDVSRASFFTALDDDGHMRLSDGSSEGGRSVLAGYVPSTVEGNAAEVQAEEEEVTDSATEPVSYPKRKHHLCPLSNILILRVNPP